MQFRLSRSNNASTNKIWQPSRYAEYSSRAFVPLSIPLFPTYIVLLLVCLHPLAAFIFRFSLIRYERTPSIFNRNKSSPSPSNPTTSARAILQAYKYYHHPLSLLFWFTPHFPRIPRDLSESVYVISHSLASLFHANSRMHEYTSAQSFAAVNDIRMPALPMYLVTLLRSLHFLAFILRLAAVFPWYFWISLPIAIVEDKSVTCISKRLLDVILPKKRETVNIPLRAFSLSSFSYTTRVTNLF